MLELKKSDFQALRNLGYEGIKESTYSFDHPEVQEWTSFFEKKTQERRIFEKFNQSHPFHSREQAIVVGTQWHRFSTFMPWFLCQAAATVPNNHLRHYVIQTAFEELGMRDANEIHPDLFLRVSELAGVTQLDRKRLSEAESITVSLQFLRTELLRMTDFSEVLGILLGLEIPARENIETVFYSLAYQKQLEPLLASTKFFALHRHLEIEHVRLNVGNFLRFCPDEISRAAFANGFNLGLDFWEIFWKSVSELIENEKRELHYE